ncbi:(2Fe-2S)-binding protein [Flindersiella endophytica]
MERSPAELLAEIATIGGYFSMSAGRPGASGAVSLAELRSGGAALEQSVAYVGERLSTADRRVAASIFFQGLAARLWSPVVAAHLLGTGIGLVPERTWWHPTEGCYADDPTIDGTVSDVWPDLLEPLATTIRTEIGLSAHILRGNAASALVGTLKVLSRVRPGLAQRCDELARTQLATGPLAGTCDLTTRGFVRRSCCLYYRLPGGGLCGDCLLGRP